MRLNLRFRIFLTLVPLLALLGVLGGAGVVLLSRLGGSIDLILRENYASVIAMERLNEALERIDSSFQFALAGKEEKARQQYESNWPAYRQALVEEEHNITLPGEGELVDELRELTDRYRRQGDAFYARPTGAPDRNQRYFGADVPTLGASTMGLAGSPGHLGSFAAVSAFLARESGSGSSRAGLLRTFEEIKRVSGEILLKNQQNMKDASRDSRKLANASVFWFSVGLVTAVCLAFLLAFRTIRTILLPIQAMTQSALAIGRGDLDQVVAVTSRDELGQLADAFNTMGRQLRQYRQSDYARLLRAQRTSQATIDSFPDPVLVVDPEWRVEMANPAARRLLGITPRASDGSASPAWQPPTALKEPLTAALQQQQDYRPEGFDHAVPLRSDGKDCFFLPRILSIRDPFGNTLGAAALLQDVSRFQLLDEMKSNLVATVSHELKAPLTSIRLVVHLLLEETVGSLIPKQTELLLDARENTERLLATINNLLDLTRLERGEGKLQTRPEAPGELLQAAAEVIRPRAEDKGVEVEVDVPPDLPAVVVDAQRFGHAVNNLLDNAITYTNRGGHIHLSATASPEAVVLTVSDTGIGIPSEFLPRVFERFFRVPGQSPEGGTGLGLAIVQEIVSAHGGTITCESEPGAGTRFRITLPLASSDGRYQPPTTAGLHERG
jgi:signal transduction histidine kinase